MLYLLLFSIAANLDNFIFSAVYTMLRYKITQKSILILSLVTTTVTMLSILLGSVLHQVLPETVSTLISTVLLFGIAVYLIYRSFGKTEETVTIQTKEMKLLDLFVLGSILSLNNFGIGIGISKHEIDFFWLFVFNFGFGYLFFLLGVLLFSKWMIGKVEQRISFVTGVILIILALVTLFS